MKSSRLCAAAISIVVMLGVISQTHAQRYPTKPVRMLVGFAPGGGVDVTARIVASKLSELWGQPVVIDSRAGAGGTIATDLAAKAPADGYSLLFCGIWQHGGAPALADLLGGHIPAMFDNMSTQLTVMKAGRTRALAVTSPKRSVHLPDVPTMRESGVPIDVTVWYGICAPAAVPKPILGKINADLNRVLTAADTQRRLVEVGVDAAPSTPEQFAAFIKSETETWARVVREAKVPQQ